MIDTALIRIAALDLYRIPVNGHEIQVARALRHHLDSYHWSQPRHPFTLLIQHAGKVLHQVAIGQLLNRLALSVRFFLFECCENFIFQTFKIVQLQPFHQLIRQVAHPVMHHHLDTPHII